jgi:hypothetical protein
MKIMQVQDHIVTLYRAGMRYTLFLQGQPGIGKSESAIGASKALGIKYRQWQATIEDPLELPGLPAVVNGQAKRLPFEDKIPGNCTCNCKACKDKKDCINCLEDPKCDGVGILIIDEINSAPPLTQASLYSLVWDRKLGGSRLGDGWMIIATGNRADDRAVTQKMPTPLVSRMEHITVEPDHDGWVVKMAVDGGEDTVRAFVKSRIDLFCKFNPNIPGPFPCPRTWKMVSDVMIAYGEKEPPLESVAGWVGEGPAVEFLAYRKMTLKLPDPEDIIKNPEKIKFPDEPGPLYAITTALAGRANYGNIAQIIKFIERIPVEYAVYCISLARDVERGRMEKMSEEEKKKFRKQRENESFKKWALGKYDLIVD